MEKLKSWMTIRNASLFFLAIALSYLVLLGSNVYETWLKRDNRTKVDSTLLIYRDAAEVFLRTRVNLIDGLERFVLERSDEEIEKDFQTYAPGLHNNLEGVRNVALAPNGILKYVYPLRGNEQALNHNLLTDNTPTIKADVARALESKKTIISDPYQLRQGGLGIVARKAIFKETKFWGFATMVIDVPAVLELTGLEKGKAGLDLALRDKSGKVFWGETKVFETNPVIRRTAMVDGNWEMGAVSLGGWKEGVERPLTLFRIVTVMIAVLIWSLIALLLQRDTGLVIAEGKLSEKTRSGKIVLVYIVVSILWILLSDKALAAVFTDPRVISELQTIKGILFVAITSLLLYWLIESNYGKYLITSRALRSILEGNRILVRAKDEKELFQGICDELVTKSGYHMAWIGMVQEDKKELIPIGKAGEVDDFFEEIEVSWRAGGLETPCAEAMKTGKAVIINDVSEVAKYPEWRIAAEKRNFKSVISLPLMENEKPVGIMAIYSSKINAFTYGDLELLNSFANDLVFGLKVIKINKYIASEKQKLEAVLNDMGDAVYTTDQNGKVVMVNKAMESLTGSKEKDLKGKSFKEMKIVFEKNDESGDELVEKILNSGMVVTPKKHLALINSKNEKVAVDFIGTPIKDETGKVTGSVVVLRDITRQRRLETVKTDFVSLASHQLRSPLTGIKWFVELLLQSVDTLKPQKTKEYIEKIGESNEKLIELVNDLLVTSRIDEGKYDLKKFENVKVKTLLSDSYKLVERKFKNKQVKLVGVDKVPVEAVVQVDMIQMVQVFTNLLDNAVNYSPKGSTVEVSFENTDNEVKISIKDSGLGIPVKQQEKIFEKFFRADNVVKGSIGTGLGLYMTKSIVEGHGGKIWFRSEENKGTTFYVKLLIRQK